MPVFINSIFLIFGNVLLKVTTGGKLRNIYIYNGLDKSFFLEWTNNVKVKIDEKISHLTNKLYANKHMDCLSSTDVKNALDNIHKDFVVVPIYKGTGNIDFVCKRFYASVITRELGLNNNSSTDTYNNAGGLSENDIIDGNIRNLKIIFGIDNIPIENHLICIGCLRFIKTY